VIVDEYGLLGDLYRLADISFVGGGFHRAGLHSVLEPAAFGTPVVFGPHHGTRREARLLIEAGGGRSVGSRAQLDQVLREWLRDPAGRALAGAAARSFVQDGLGAAERSYALVAGLLEVSGSAPTR
jgi:3-deoxy-D-manno-octulosonic-acid transferase